MLNKINSINDCLNLEKNNKLNNLINAYSLSLKNLSIDEVSNVINEELDKFILHLKNGNDNNNINNGEEIIKKNKQAMEKINDIFGFITTLNNTKINIQNYLNDVEKLIKVKDIEKKKERYTSVGVAKQPNEMKIFETDDIKVCEVEVWESETSSAVVSL